MWLDCDLMWVNCSFMSMFRTITYYNLLLCCSSYDAHSGWCGIEWAKCCAIIWGRSIEKKTWVSIWDLSCLVSLLQVIFSLDPSVTMLFLLRWSVFLPWEKQVYEGSPPFYFLIGCFVHSGWVSNGGGVRIWFEWDHWLLKKITAFLWLN